MHNAALGATEVDDPAPLLVVKSLPLFSDELGLSMPVPMRVFRVLLLQSGVKLRLQLRLLLDTEPLHFISREPLSLEALLLGHARHLLLLGDARKFVRLLLRLLLLGLLLLWRHG